MVARVVSAVAPHGALDRCPGALHAIAADDGALVRVRVPGGDLSITAMLALANLAERYGSGFFDLTARANVQVRGLREADLGRVGDRLASAGLLPAAEHERVRNIVANPFAGHDPAELVDVRPFVAALDRALVAAPEFVALPPKFLVAIDGGGRGLVTRGADLIARATTAARGGAEARFEISIAGDARTLDVAAGDVVASLLALARHALRLAAHKIEIDGDEGQRVRRAGEGSLRAAKRAGADRADGVEVSPSTSWRLASFSDDVERIPPELAQYLAQARDERAAALEPRVYLGSDGRAPLGVYADAVSDRAVLVPSIPLGRITVAQARLLAEIAAESATDVRLGWWRGVALCGVPRTHLADVSARLARARMPLDGSDGYAGVAACAGRGSCDAALADVRGDAAAYAARIAHDTDASAMRSINFAGCEKRCAMRRGAAADLVATRDGYQVWVRGACIATAPNAEAAIALATAHAR